MHIQMGTFSGSFLDTAVQGHAPLLTLELLKGDVKCLQNLWVKSYQDLLCSNSWLKQVVPGPLPVCHMSEGESVPSIVRFK